MNQASRQDFRARFGLSIGALLLLLPFAGDAHAQWAIRWLNVGELHHPYIEIGIAAEALLRVDDDDQFWSYPGMHPMNSNTRGEGLWISAKNVRDQDDNNWSVRVSHSGPRVDGVGEFYRGQHHLISKFEPPLVEVDGLASFNRAVIVDETDETIPADRMIHSIFHTSVGITGEMRSYQLSNEYHDNYHIIEYEFTNTGQMSSDPDAPRVEQTLEDVYFTFMYREAPSARIGGWIGAGDGAAWGQYTMSDAVGDGFHDYDIDFRGHFSWLGNSPDRSPAGPQYSALGGPLWTDDGWLNPVRRDTIGRLSAAYTMGKAVLFAPSAPGGTVDDPAQPRVMTFLDSDNGALTGSSDHNNQALMEMERQFIETGIEPGQSAHIGAGPRMVPYHAWVIEPSGDFSRQSVNPGLGGGGIQNITGYGPYTMAHGESVRIVYVRAAAGLSDEAAHEIGKAYKRSGGNDDLLIPFRGAGGEVHSLTKNQWVISTRDSLFQAWERAREVFHNVIETRNFNAIPQPPRPPRAFSVTSGADQITLEWETYAGESDPPGGWEIYRARNRYDGIAAPDSATAYTLLAALPGGARDYADTTPNRGESYYYYIQAVGAPVSNDPTGIIPDGVTLRSSRHYTQSYQPGVLVRPPGDNLANIRVVPNPYNLSADEDIRYARENRLGFLNVPGDATIHIVTQLGEMVRTIEHTAGSGDVYWDLTTTSRQTVVSGIYIAHITDNVTGESVVKKFVILR